MHQRRVISQTLISVSVKHLPPAALSCIHPSTSTSSIAMSEPSTSQLKAKEKAAESEPIDAGARSDEGDSGSEGSADETVAGSSAGQAPSTASKKKKKKRSKAAKALSALRPGGSKDEISDDVVNIVLDKVRAEGGEAAAVADPESVKKALEQSRTLPQTVNRLLTQRSLGRRILPDSPFLSVHDAMSHFPRIRAITCVDTGDRSLNEIYIPGRPRPRIVDEKSYKETKGHLRKVYPRLTSVNGHDLR